MTTIPKIRARVFALLMFLFLPLVLNGCQSSLKRYEYSKVTMGVKSRLILYAQSESQAQNAAKNGFARMDHLDSVMSDYRKSSELSILCQKAGNGPVPVSEDLFEVLQMSINHARASQGAFDMTIGPVVRLWRNARKSGALPPREALEQALQLIGWSKVRLDPGNSTADLRQPGMQLDLGGIGKGFAADACVKVLRKHGIDRCLVDLGGDIVAGDPPPRKTSWRILVEDGPLVVKLANNAVATSGDSEQHLEVDGKRYSHIVDPSTGLGLTHRCLVTVIAPNGSQADALASTLSVLPPAAGIEHLSRWPQSEARIVFGPPERSGHRESPGFRKMRLLSKH